MFRTTHRTLAALALTVGMTCLLGAPAEAPAADPPSGIPAHAKKVAPWLYHLGFAKDRLGRVVEGYLILHPKRRDKKPDHAGGGGGGGKKGGGTSDCFSVLAKGAQWKTSEPWVVQTSNSTTDGTIDASYIVNAINSCIGTWEAVTSDDIFGSGSTGTVNGADENAPDGVNEVLFADIPDSGTLAYTITWGIFSGSPRNRELVEWDMVFDDDGDWTWTDDTSSNASNAANAIDFDTVLLHELGHALGLDHSPEGCLDEIMAAYYAGTQRTLGEGDIAGAQSMYGSN